MVDPDDIALLRELSRLAEDDPTLCQYWGGLADDLEAGRTIPEFVALMNYARSVKRNYETGRIVR